MLQNEYLVAKIGVDTAENGPRKECCVVARCRREECDKAVARREALLQLQQISKMPLHATGVKDSLGAGRATTHHSFRGSFSAVSTPIFATKYSFCSIFRDLQNELAEFAKFCQFFQKNRKIRKILQKSENFTEILQNLQNFAKF